MKSPIDVSKEWCLNMAAKEGAAEIGAGELPLEANARLISAAPDLYEALKAMVARWEPMEDGYGDRRMWENACAALAKAEGRP